jgi:superfamily II DNA or RNA helicase
MTFTPYPSEEDMERGAIITEVAENELSVSRFDDRHVRIAEIVGPGGLTIPAAGLEMATATMGLLASVVTVHSDAEITGSDVETADADDRLYVMVHPIGEGLEAEVVTRPLGEGTPPCKPGAGGGSVFGAHDGRRIRASRDLKRETESLGGFISSCAALREADQLAENRWRLDDSRLSLEFLLQLQELESLVVAEWPKGQSMSVRRLDPSRASMSVRNAGDWFSVSGRFEVNEDLTLGMKEMLRLIETSNGRFIAIGKNQFVALTEEFKKRLADMAAFGEQRGDELRLHHLSAAALGPVSGDGGEIFHGAAWEDIRAKIAEAEGLRFSPPPDFKCEMRDYQADGFAWLMRLAHWGAGACLADDMGLGKTIQALAVLLARAPGGPALVVAPTSVCANWIAEATKFAPTLRFVELRGGDRESMVSSLGPMDALVATYGLLQNELELVSGVRWRTIVLDEAQAIKNIGTKRSAAAMKLEGDFKIVTTGTPVENNLSELWNIFRFINPGYLGSHEHFTRKFAAPIERDGDAAARKRLKRMIAPFVLRRTKAAVLSELPPKTEITLEVELKEAERALYEAVRRNALEELDASGVDDKRFMVFAQLVKLRRACCNSTLVKGSPGVMESAKLEAFTELIGEITSGGHKALVFSQFVDHLAILRARLDEMGTAYQYLDGSTSPAEREARVKKFQSGEGDCFLISLKAGGVGLNLTAADYVIHMDPWWNPAVEEQASDRTHRIGQERPVTVFRIVAKGTIEEKIVSLHAWKKDLAASLLDESSAPSRISTDELIGIIRGDSL